MDAHTIVAVGVVVWMLWCIANIIGRPAGMSLRDALLACLALHVGLAIIVVGAIKLTSA